MGAKTLGTQDIIGRYYLALEQLIGKSWVDLVSMMFDSDQESETYNWLGQAPAMREWIGGRNAKGFRENGITIVNKHFEATQDVLTKYLRRDKTGQLDVRIDELAGRTVSHWASLLSTLITNGTGATSGLCYDGQYYFDSDHSEGESGTQKNLITATEVTALNVTTPAAPTATEAIAAILGVIAYMLNYKDDQGEPMNSEARRFLIMTSPALWARLTPATVASQVTSGETNVIKELEKDGFKVSVVPNARLTYTTQFVTFRTDSKLPGLIRQNETEPEVKILGPGSDYEFNNAAWQVGVDAWRNVAYGYWQFASHSTFS